MPKVEPIRIREALAGQNSRGFFHLMRSAVKEPGNDKDGQAHQCRSQQHCKGMTIVTMPVQNESRAVNFPLKL
jgi:hypothetical protein